MTKEFIKEIVERHPKILQTEGVMGGQPTLLRTRVRVVDVLSAIITEGSIKGVIENWEWNYTEEDIKDAIRFARDFLGESWCVAKDIEIDRSE